MIIIPGLCIPFLHSNPFQELRCCEEGMLDEAAAADVCVATKMCAC